VPILIGAAMSPEYEEGPTWGPSSTLLVLGLTGSP